MALHFTIKMNDQMIGSFVAQRRQEVVPLDGRCQYDVTVMLNGTERSLMVEHGYHEGALVLIRRALELVAGVDFPYEGRQALPIHAADYELHR